MRTEVRARSVVHDTRRTRLAALEPALDDVRGRRSVDRRRRDRSTRRQFAVDVDARRPRTRDAGPAPTPCAWLDDHVNLETGVGVPVGARTGGPRRRAAARRGSGARSRSCWVRPELEYPVIHVTGTNGKTSAARMIDRPAGRRTGSRSGTYTSPHLERVNERMAWNGEPIADDDLDRAARRDRRRSRTCSRDAPELLRDPHRRRACAGSPTSRSTSPSSRSGWAARWDATNVVDGRGRGRHQREHRPHRVPRADARRHRDARRPGSSSPTSTLVLGETDPELVPVFQRARAATVAACATATSACARNQLAHRRPARRPAHAVRGRTPTCSSRCTARTRPTTPRSRSPRPRRSSDAPLDAEVVAEAFATVRDARALRGGRPPAAGPARRRAQRRRRATRARRARRRVRRRRPRTLVVGFAAREGPARDARGARRRRRGDVVVCCTSAEPRAAAMPHGRRRRGRATLGVEHDAWSTSIDDVRRGGARFALDVAPRRRPGRGHRLALRGRPAAACCARPALETTGEAVRVACPPP